MAAKRDWRTDHRDGSLTLSMSVEVNGKVFATCAKVDNGLYSLNYAPPAHYVERQMRHELMRAVEDELLGPLPR